MIKLLGAVLIVFSTSWIGWDFSKRLIARPKQIRDLRAALQILEAEIMYGHMPLREAVLKLAKQIPEPVARGFTLFADYLNEENQTVTNAWRQSIEEMMKWTELEDKEAEILLQFGETLGKHDRDTQRKQIQLALTHLEREEMLALDKQMKYDKMVKSLGFFSGLLIAILLL
ncbi:stage III sporulation protein SpoAB [Bacillus sp. FJAT-27916]|uniref:stage III sporulation protein SpoIIIAB n=1 Tax=Bacillaceae TaxID=186817 RepID=UPI000670F17F|nr:stage III sporulation protein SpoIIIAB [Bacillus sp. FJAT-27916]KMY43805.1 stage III sporulation protein SpoAB [Bacillus sp. FJAT-27916]